MSTYQELLSQKAALDAQAAELAAKLEVARTVEKADTIAQIKADMKFHDIKLSDLGTPRSKSARAAKTPRASNSVNPLAGRKIPIKYRGPGGSWSGRGLQPKWLREAIALGASLESFEVAA